VPLAFRRCRFLVAVLSLLLLRLRAVRLSFFVDDARHFFLLHACFNGKICIGTAPIRRQDAVCRRPMRRPDGIETSRGVHQSPSYLSTLFRPPPPVVQAGSLGAGSSLLVAVVLCRGWVRLPLLLCRSCCSVSVGFVDRHLVVAFGVMFLSFDGASAFQARLLW
jgi:hypothetical protein